MGDEDAFEAFEGKLGVPGEPTSGTATARPSRFRTTKSKKNFVKVLSRTGKGMASQGQMISMSNKVTWGLSTTTWSARCLASTN